MSLLLPTGRIPNRAGTRIARMEPLSGHSHDFIATEADGECYVSIDIEADGPAPGLNSMLSLGAAAFISEGAVMDTFSANLDAREDPKTTHWWAKQPRGVGRVSHADPEPSLGHARGDASLGASSSCPPSDTARIRQVSKSATLCAPRYSTPSPASPTEWVM